MVSPSNVFGWLNVALVLADFRSDEINDPGLSIFSDPVHMENR